MPKPNKPKGLTPKQELFCQFYALTFNASKSAVDAGYSKKTAKATGYENMTKQAIQDRLKELLAPQEAEARGRVADLAERNEILTNIARNTELNSLGLSVVNESDKIRAVDTLNKAEGIYIEKRQISGHDGKELVSTLKFVPV